MANSKLDNRDQYLNDKWEERYTSALTLITIGLVLLLNTSGTLSWSVWIEFLKFWPVFIISAGIQLIFSFNTFAKFIGNLAGYLIFITLLFFAAVNTGSPAFQGFTTWVPRYNIIPFNMFDEQTEYINEKSEVINKEEYSDINETEINIETAYGYFEIIPMLTDNVYISFDSLSNTDDPFTLEKSFDQSKLMLDLITNNKKTGFWQDNPKYYLAISKDLPSIDLNYKIGAGRADLDLSNSLDLNNVSIEIGAGEVISKLGTDSLPSNMELIVGAGELTLSIPESAGIMIEYNVGVGSITIDGERSEGGLAKKGTYESDNFDDALKKINIKVEVGVGSLNIKFI